MRSIFVTFFIAIIEVPTSFAAPCSQYVFDEPYVTQPDGGPTCEWAKHNFAYEQKNAKMTRSYWQCMFDTYPRQLPNRAMAEPQIRGMDQQAAEAKKLLSKSCGSRQAHGGEEVDGICGVLTDKKIQKDGSECLLVENKCTYKIGAHFTDSRQTGIQTFPVASGKVGKFCGFDDTHHLTYVASTKYGEALKK